MTKIIFFNLKPSFLIKSGYYIVPSPSTTLINILNFFFSERSLLRGQYNRAASPNSSFAVILGQVIDHLEATTLFSEEEDAIEMADESSEVMLDINSLETEAARLLIPFLRTASLMKLYIYKENLPEIKEDDQEFDQLVKFLDLISVVEAASGLRGHGADKHMHSDQPTDETEVHMEDESTQMSFQVRFGLCLDHVISTRCQMTNDEI